MTKEELKELETASELRVALILIRGEKCESVTTPGFGHCLKNGRVVSAQYGDDQACHSCIAKCSVKREVDIPEGGQRTQMSTKAKYFITKHYGEGFVHHIGRTVSTLKEAKAQAKRFKFKGGFRGKAVLRIWKMEEEIKI